MSATDVETETEPAACSECRGLGYHPRGRLQMATNDPGDCRACDGLGWLGINPFDPLPAGPGAARVPYLQVRYAMGQPLFQEQDRRQESGGRNQESDDE